MQCIRIRDSGSLEWIDNQKADSGQDTDDRCSSSCPRILYAIFRFTIFSTSCFYTVVGFGVASTQSGANVFVGELPRATMMLNFLHTIYGLGALLGPFVASAILRYSPWNYSYLVLSSLATFNLITCIFTFRHLKITEEQDQDDRRRQIGSPNILEQTIRYHTTYVGAFYLSVYVGIEVTFGELAYTFLISERSHDRMGMAHLMSGFWTGLCIGRICLGYVTLKLGEKRMIYVYITVLICMCITFWLVEIVAVNAVALVVSGIALGPLFPTILSVARECVPCNLYFGSCRSALLPYFTSVLMNSTGPSSMPPLTLAMSCTILVTWFFIFDPESDSVFRRLRNCVTGNNNLLSGS
ncbi:major facilitator superfamily domain-containing protein [Fennellomyces sp. T-0311]|nr:major facilitator superfamily domain-containing protein [Fennellomyces sp. T-0311]